MSPHPQAPLRHDRPCFKLIVLARDDSVRNLPDPFDPDFTGPGICEMVVTVKNWKDVRPKAEEMMRAWHNDYGSSVRVTCVTPGDRVPPFFMNEKGEFSPVFIKGPSASDLDARTRQGREAGEES